MSSAAEAAAGRLRPLPFALVFIALVVAAIGSLGAPLITAVAEDYDVSLAAAQWTLTITLLAGAVATPLLGRLGTDDRRRAVVLTTLLIVLAGSVATALPAPFAVLLGGRAAQGIGLGLAALMMATARRHLGDRAPATTAMLAVASTVGIGIGYPLAGLLVQTHGVRVAYLLGVVVSAADLLVAALVLPPDSPRARTGRPTDWVGAVVLSIGLIAILLVTSDTEMWSTAPAIAAAVLVAGLAVLGFWAAVERRAAHPLVDLTALRHPAVARANLVMVVSGIAMYLLFTLITRFVQSPPATGYGYGLSDVQAGLVLVPFSVLGFVAGRLAPRLHDRVGPFRLLATGGIVLLAAAVLFAILRDAGVAWPIIAMGVLGLGVGGVSAAMPPAIFAATPAEKTAAAMSVNQVARSVGFSIGSAVSALVLAGYTPAGGFVPADHGYATAAWVGAGLTAAAVILAVIRIGPRRADPGSATRRE